MTLQNIYDTHPMLPQLMNCCYEAFNCEPEKRDTRLSRAMLARKAFVLLVQQNYYPQLTLIDMGRIMALCIGRENHYDHATIIYAISTAKETLLLRDDVSMNFRDNCLMLKAKYFPFGMMSFSRRITKQLTQPV